MELKLKVQNLVISFKTASGKLQAVRNISFDLYKGETLAIVGESGSGKSVTSRAIMGILANNAIVDEGKILYGDKDLLKISEEEFHKIRGDKIAMVFQDPLSSLNPIMKVGKQLTEAMLLKNKAARRENRADMNRMFKALETYMEAVGEQGAIKADLSRFRKFEIKHCELESRYQSSLAYAQELLALSENLSLRIKKNSENNIIPDMKEAVRAAKEACSRFVINEKAADAAKLSDELINAYKEGKQSGDRKRTPELLSELGRIADEALKKPVPDTFSIGYYLTYVQNSIPDDMDVTELNAKAGEKMKADFLDGFLGRIEKAVRYSAQQTNQARSEALKLFQKMLPEFEGKLEKSTAAKNADELKKAVAAGIDKLEVELDSVMHTFATSIDYALEHYFSAVPRNEAEKKRFESETAKYERLKAKGKQPEWEVVPASYVDVDAAQAGITDIMKEMMSHLQYKIKQNEDADFAARTAEIVDYLKKCAADSVYRISRSAAKERAVKLMESVGIDEPRKRFDQYPFEFSGGMRQRIVIAIALTADPDVLICDEPTTALDVTIQAQILELINNLKKERDLSVIFITHDLGVVANMADRVAVMYAGKIVEHGTVEDIFYEPAHPYTWALLSSVPDLDTKDKLESIPGTPPNMIYPPVGDAFADRNKYALAIDFERQPPMFRITDSHYAATWLLHPNAPKTEPPEIIKQRIEKMRKKRNGENNGQEEQ